MVSNARLDLPLPLGPVTTVSLPSGRSTSIPLRLFWRAPRISTQLPAAGAVTRSFLATFEPTGNNSRWQCEAQIFWGAHAPRVQCSAPSPNTTEQYACCDWDKTFRRGRQKEHARARALPNIVLVRVRI